MSLIGKGVFIGSSASPAPPAPIEEKYVNFYDYDGTLLYSYTLSELSQLTVLPPIPTHEGLTAIGWTYSLSDLQTVAASGPVNVGCYFKTSDNKTHIFIDLQEAGNFQFYLIQSAPNAAVIDWGDGSPTEMLSVNDGTANGRTRYLAAHTYSVAGNYDISISVVSGKWYGFGANFYDGYSVVGGDQAYGKSVRKIYLSEDANIIGAAFTYAIFTEIITMTQAQASICTYKRAYYYCYNLKFAICNGNINEYVFYNCYNLKAIAFFGTRSISYYGVYYCNSIKNLNFPQIQTLNNSPVYGSFDHVKYIKIPNSCLSIGSILGVRNVSIIEEYDLTAFTDPTAPIPTLTTSFNSAFTTINMFGRKVVFSVASEAMKTVFENATNWSDGEGYYVVKGE